MAFPQGAATPEEIARLKGLGATGIVDVEFEPATGDYQQVRQREADEAVERAQAEPVLGKFAGDAPTPESQGLNRTSPAGLDAEEQRKESNKALPAEVKAAQANVEGLQQDTERLAKPQLASEVNTAEAGNADKKRKR